MSRSRRKASKHLHTAGAVPRYKLKRWHAEFACWLAEQPHKPSTAEMLEAASGFANSGRDPKRPAVRISFSQLRTLREREDFNGLLSEIERGGIELAKAKFLAHLPELIDLHLWGARRSKEKDDTRGLVNYTVPGLDRAVPKNPDLALVQPQQFVFAISEKRLAELDAPAIEVTTERIPPLELPPGSPPRAETPAKEREWITQSELLQDARAREKLGLPQNATWRPLPGES